MKKKQTHLMYGALTGVAMIITGVILYVTGVAFVKGVSYVTYIPFLLLLILNARAYSKANDGFVTFANIYGSCFKASLIAMVIMTVWAMAQGYVFPDMKTKALEMARTEAAKNPKMTDEMLDTSMNMMNKYWAVFMVGGTIFMTTLLGAILSLIAAATGEKKGERPFTADNF